MSLFELNVIRLVPPIGYGKTLQTNAIAEDGLDYAVKAQTEHTLLPATEWFCYQLAQAVGLGCPASAILVMPDGSRAFGSRIEVGLSNMQDDVKSGTPPEEFLVECADRLSIAYALDIFIANTDRHFGNFLFRRNSLNQRTLMPIDYSNAWWVSGWPPADLTASHSTTSIHLEIVRGMGLWRTSHALMALGTLSQIPHHTLRGWLDAMPKAWFSEVQKASFLTWWGGSEFHAHVSKCVKYCQA
jgi:hypothetical protein